MPSLPETLRSSLSPRTLAAFIVVTASALAPPLVRAQTVPLQRVPLEMRSAALALVQVCRGDYDRLCPGVVPGGGRVLACLQSQANELSTTCAQAMTRAQMLKDRAATAGVLPK